MGNLHKLFKPQSIYISLGGLYFSVWFSTTGPPSKHTAPASEAPPNSSQKALFECHISVSLVELNGKPTPSCNAKGEFNIDTFLHSSQTFEQKSTSASWDWVEFTETVELQRTGTFLGVNSIW